MGIAVLIPVAHASRIEVRTPSRGSRILAPWIVLAILQVAVFRRVSLLCHQTRGHAPFGVLGQPILITRRNEPGGTVLVRQPSTKLGGLLPCHVHDRMRAGVSDCWLSIPPLSECIHASFVVLHAHLMCPH